MQNRYTGDVGDFGKYGLLRALCRADDSSPALTLGVVWYLFPHAEDNADGKHVTYLKTSPDNDRRFRNCDPSLYDGLKVIVDSSRRSVSRIREEGILAAGTRSFEEELTLGDLPAVGPHARTARERRQNDWTKRARDATTGCDAVFVDPDNGIEATSAPRLSNRGPKYVFFDDLKPYARRAQSLIVYHHLGRQAKTEQQVGTALTRLTEELHGGDPFALVYHRGTVRAFLIIPAKRHEDVLRERADRLLKTAWSEHFERFPRT
jgi:hypothetical protein